MMIYTKNTFPCFVKGGETVENAHAREITPDEKYHRIARNTLRHLTYGVSFKEANLLTTDTVSALFMYRNGALFAAVRDELQNIFSNIYACIQNKQMDADAEERAKALITHLLTLYPFLDGQDGDELFVPQKFNQQWELIHYRNERIDISPQKGQLAEFIKDKDRLYAYGLVPQSHTYAQPYLCIMGSAYPTAQGARLNWLYNFARNKSVGEAHDTSKLEQWIKRHNNIAVIGHSKGGTVAMILAAKFPNEIANAECLCPTALTNATLNNLIEKWSAIADEKKPHVNIYTQAGDPIFYLDNIFLPNTTFYYIQVPGVKLSHLMSHIHYLIGRKNVEITKLDHTAECFTSSWRNYVSQNKQALNWVVFPILYMECLLSFFASSVKDYYRNHITNKFVNTHDGFYTGLAIYSASVSVGLTLPLAFCFDAGRALTSRLSSIYSKGEKLTSSLTVAGLLAFVVVATIAVVSLYYGVTKLVKGSVGPKPPKPRGLLTSVNKTDINNDDKNIQPHIDEKNTLINPGKNANESTKLLISKFGESSVDGLPRRHYVPPRNDELLSLREARVARDVAIHARNFSSPASNTVTLEDNVKSPQINVMKY